MSRNKARWRIQRKSTLMDGEAVKPVSLKDSALSSSTPRCRFSSTIRMSLSSPPEGFHHQIRSRTNMCSLYSRFPFPSNTIHFPLKLDIRNLRLLLGRNIKRIQCDPDISIMDLPHNLPSASNLPQRTRKEGIYSLDITIPNPTGAVNALNHDQNLDERIR